jgi:hypothetical protein
LRGVRCVRGPGDCGVDGRVRGVVDGVGVATNELRDDEREPPSVPIFFV